MAVEGVNSVLKRLEELRKQAEIDQQDANVQVGYTQSYAIYVHENLDNHHPVGQAKFLEEPARRLQPVLSELIRTVYDKTKSLSKALLIAGLRLQRESQDLVPIDTSALRASAYTALDKDANEVAANVQFISDQIKANAKQRRK